VVQALGPHGWSVVGRLPTTRSDLSTASYDGRVLVVGGYDGVTPALAPIVTSADGARWHQVGALPIPVRYTATALDGGFLWLFGGESDHRMRDAVQRIDLTTGEVKVVGRLPRPLGHASAMVLGDRVLVVGGRTSSDVLSDRMWWFDTVTHTFARAGRLPTPLADSAVTTYGGAAYLIGGETPSFSDRVIRLSLR
jgi:N-acetylneuraminic acid mutarotase